MKQGGASSIRRFWQRLESTIHPGDADLFKAHPHTFNLDFPPPAFIGDVDSAPVVILMANGGYDPVQTASEFPNVADREEHLQFLWGQRPNLPRNFSKYYERGGMLRWVEQGNAVIVNAIAYRSPKISAEPRNQKLAKLLVSGKVHKQWLREEVLPAADKGDRLVIAHRSKLWDFPEHEALGRSHIYHSRCPASPLLSNDVTAAVRSWLVKKGFSK